MRNHTRRPLSLLLAVALMFGLSAPAMAAGSSDVAVDVTITGDTLIPAGSTAELTATFTKPGGYDTYEIRKDSVVWTWTSGNDDIAEVKSSTKQADNSSVAVVEMDSTLYYQSTETAITASVTFILDEYDAQRNVIGSATASGSKTFKVVPDYARATGLAFSPPVVSATVEVGGKTNLYVEVSPFNANQNDLYWYLEEGGDKVVRLNTSKGQAAEITAVAPGYTKVFVQVPNSPTLSRFCTIAVPGIVLNSNSVTLKVGEAFQLIGTPYEVGYGSGITWSSNNMSVVQVGSNGELSAIAPGTAVVTATVGEYSATCNVTVAENTATSILEELSAGQPLDFEDLMARLNSISLDAGSASLDYITNLSVATSEGILYYGYASSDNTGLGVGVTERYYYSPNSALGERGIADLTFVPKNGFTGTVTISYTGYSRSNISFTGKIKLDVESTSDIIYTTSLNTPVEFETVDFSDTCRAQTSRALSYITFTLPSSSRGTLYYNYGGAGLYAEPVESNTPYYVTASPRLDAITFVPAEDYSGTVRINYTGVDTSGSSFTGQIVIVVDGGSTSWEDLIYQVNPSGYVEFKASDFNTYCRSITGHTLNYIRFTLPDSAKGSLYYNYSSNGSYDSAVSNSTKYYYSKKPTLSNISFVAGNSFTAPLFIDFIGYDTSGNKITGKVCVEPPETVYEGTGDIYYTARSGQSVTFDAADFNEVSLDCTGNRLSYVQFDLPASGRGKLYYNYISTSTTKTAVSSSYKYYRNSYRYLSQVTFVPASGSGGTTAITFTGYDVEGTSFEGTVWVEVQESGVENLNYSVTSGGAVEFNVSDFNTVCKALTGVSLNYIRFALPDADEGILCYKYNTGTGKYNSKVTATTSYYRTGNSRLLSDVSFVSDPQFSGTVKIEYTGWNTDNTKFTGTITVSVSEPTAETIRYTGSVSPISLRAADFSNACSSLFRTELASIKFSALPDEAAGRLYLNYVSPNRTGTAVTAGRSYYLMDSPSLSDISFVPKAEYQGTVTLRYTGTDTAGATFTGTISFIVSNGNGASSFTDMGSYAWASPSVEFLTEFGIVNGVGGSSFGPSQYIRRGDFVLMLCRAFNFNTGSTASFSDVPADSYYAWAIATAKDLGIVQGSGGLFLPQSVLTRQDAMVMIKRAMSAAGISVSEASTYLLAYYTDGSEVQSYARDAVATLVQAGVVNGTDTGQLLPLNPIRRAEMAVILHRVLTL